MSKCIDCLHYNTCIFGKCDIISGCPFYTAHSEWVHLPCKVGDLVYRPSKCLGVVQFVITSFNMYQSEMFFTDDSENIIYLPDIGKTLFLTREEAEKALKEKKGVNESDK